MKIQTPVITLIVGVALAVVLLVCQHVGGVCQEGGTRRGLGERRGQRRAGRARRAPRRSGATATAAAAASPSPSASASASASRRVRDTAARQLRGQGAGQPRLGRDRRARHLRGRLLLQRQHQEAWLKRHAAQREAVHDGQGPRQPSPPTTPSGTRAARWSSTASATSSPSSRCTSRPGSSSRSPTCAAPPSRPAGSCWPTAPRSARLNPDVNAADPTSQAAPKLDLSTLTARRRRHHDHRHADRRAKPAAGSDTRP